MRNWLRWNVVRPMRIVILERIPWWVASRLPRRIVCLAAIRLVAFAASGKYKHQDVFELTAMDAIGRWE